MRYSSASVVFQEIPNEISLAFHVTGCPLKCPGCHSADTWSDQSGEQLSLESLKQLIHKNRFYITCVLFLGGEWSYELVKFLEEIKSENLKTALYTGLEKEKLDKQILKNLDYLKYGSYQKDLGGLSSTTTNQKLINLNTGECLNYYFTGREND